MELKGISIPISQKDKMRSKAAMEELHTLAAPLVEWLRKYHDPHTEIHISWDRVCVKHDGAGIPFPDSEK